MKVKNKNYILGILVTLLVCFFASSCSQPVSYEKFISSSKVDSLEYYDFEVNFSDSTQVYDIYFYTRLDMPFTKKIPTLDLPIEVIWKSPSGIHYRESIIFSKTEIEQYYTKDYYVLYRKRISPNEHGIWKLSARFISDIALVGNVNIYGLGLRIIHHPIED